MDTKSVGLSCKPRVNGATLVRVLGREVILVGRVEKSNGETLVMYTSDSKPMQIQCSEIFEPGEIVEVVIRLDKEGFRPPTSIVNLGASFDLSNYDAFVEVSRRDEFKNLFSDI
eukprot:TRINITY_DN23421_c0_g1_i1.p1 TRINITY_DN23421_c0_g1~~TRINITY_DN23421_c0_g1_i1.p1  ORF type:complete len:114 (+),score=34.57 TRINITY_DN23421_c0_g1_i1:122-463(+)